MRVAEDIRGRYFYCLHDKERKKNNIVNCFHPIGPEKQAQKKVGSGPLNYDQVPQFGVFFKLCASH